VTALPDTHAIGEMIRVFCEASFLDFLHRFGWAGFHALTAWLLTAPVLIATIYFAARPALQRALMRSLGQTAAVAPSHAGHDRRNVTPASGGPAADRITPSQKQSA